MPLSPDLASFLDLCAMAPPMSAMTPSQARAAYDAASLLIDLPGADVEVEALAIPGSGDHQIPARLYRSRSSPMPSPVLLFFHGGGYVLGNLDSHDSLCRDLAAFSGGAVLAVDYRLAPEHRFPAAFEDAVDAHRWLLTHGAEHALDAGRLAIGGDSVGGSLAAACCIAARDAGRPQPALQLLLYPCTASRQESASHRRLAHGHLLEGETLRWMFGHALRDDSDRDDWRFAPAAAASLADLAAAHVVVAEYDPLVDEGQDFALALRAAGVRVSLQLARGMVHDFARLGAVVDDAVVLRRALGNVLANAWLGR